MNDAGAADTSLLRAANVSKYYRDGRVRAVDDVSLEIAPGEFVSIMGKSGCGKSTLLNILGGLDRPSAGDVYFQGVPLASLPSLDRFRAEKLGFVFQSFHLLPTLTALQNVQIPMFETVRSPRERVRRAEALLDRVGMRERARHLPNELSIGERQRVAIARALANQPVLILADEPTGNLDSSTAMDVLDLLGALHRDQGVTLVIVTHDATVAQRGARSIEMRDGRIVSISTDHPPTGEVGSQ